MSDLSISELCYWCDMPYVDGKPDCTHPELASPEVVRAGEMLMLLDCCEHFCCGLSPKICRAKRLAEILKDQE